MCMQVIETYAMCGCIYHVHGVDACSTYGLHPIANKIVQVGYACPQHIEGMVAKSATWYDDSHCAVDVADEGVRTTPPHHPKRAAMLNILGNVLGTRFKRTGAMEDLKADVENKISHVRRGRRTRAERDDRHRMRMEAIARMMVTAATEVEELLQASTWKPWKDSPDIDISEPDEVLASDLFEMNGFVYEDMDIQDLIDGTAANIMLDPASGTKSKDLRSTSQSRYEQETSHGTITLPGGQDGRSESRGRESMDANLETSSYSKSIPRNVFRTNQTQKFSQLGMNPEQAEWSDNDEESTPLSVLSDGQTSISSRTSFMLDATPLNLAEQLVSLLLSQWKLKSLCLEAIGHQAVGPDRFERRFRRLLKAYAADLKKEASEVQWKQHAAADFVHSRARYAAAKIRQSCDDNFENRQRNPIIEDWEKESGESSQEDCFPGRDNVLSKVQLASMEIFMIECKAFGTLCANLENFIWPTWENKLNEVMLNLSEKIIEGNELQGFKRMIADITESDVTTIEIHDGVQRSLIEQIQYKLEQRTKTEWDWYPLFPPRPVSCDSSPFIKWRCNCGDDRWAQIPAAAVPKLSKLISKEQSSVATKINAVPKQPASSSKASADSNAPISISSLKGHVDTQSTSTMVTASEGSIATECSGRGTALKASKTNLTAETTCKKLHIFLAVNRSDDLKLSQILTHDIHDDTFFDELKKDYTRLRGLLRQIFSIWRYSGCNFFQFEKIEDHELVPRGEGMPPITNPEYHFTPKPADPMPPVSRHEFKRRFYNCYKGFKRHRHFLTNCRRNCRKKQDALKRIPKRDREVNEEGDEREIFWGLLAVEEPSFLGMIVYHLVFVAGPVVFWILWLTMMGHEGDLQNASIPVITVIGFLSLFWSPLLSREKTS